MRIQGRKSSVSVISPMCSAMRSPAAAVNVQTSRSPRTISPVWVPPFDSGPPWSAAETVMGDPVLYHVEAVSAGAIESAVETADKHEIGSCDGRYDIADLGCINAG